MADIKELVIVDSPGSYPKNTQYTVLFENEIVCSRTFNGLMSNGANYTAFAALQVLALVGELNDGPGFSTFAFKGFGRYDNFSQEWYDVAVRNGLTPKNVRFSNISGTPIAPKNILFSYSNGGPYVPKRSVSNTTIASINVNHPSDIARLFKALRAVNKPCAEIAPTILKISPNSEDFERFCLWLAQA